MRVEPTIKRNPGYYLMAHAARYIRPGSVRVHSSEVDQLPNVTCLTPDQRMVMVVMNDADVAKRFRVQHQGAYATLELGTAMSRRSGGTCRRRRRRRPSQGVGTPIDFSRAWARAARAFRPSR